MARTPWMDRLKVVAISGVIVVHAGTAYVIDIPWYYDDERTTSSWTPDAVLLPTFLAAVYGLAPLFMVAGFLSERSLSRKGPAGFASSRLVRLGVPIVLYVALIDPLADYLGDIYHEDTPSLASFLTDPGTERDLGPVWFLAALLAFSLVLAGWRHVRPSRPAERGESGGRGEPAEPIRVGVLVAIALVVAVADFLVWLRVEYMTDVWWNLQLQHWPQAAGVFAVGVLACRRGWFATLSRDSTRTYGRLTALGVVALLGVAVASVSDVSDMLGGWHWAAAAFALLDGATAIVLCVWLAGWMGRRWNAPLRPWLGAASRGAYGAYLLHPLVLVAVSLAAKPLPGAPELKWVLVSVVGVPACFAAGYLVTRVPRVGELV